MGKIKKVIILSFSLFFFTACTCNALKKKPSPAEKAAHFCASDADCVAVKADCCGCSAGGTQKALLRSALPEALAQLKKQCGETMCIQMISKDESCKKNPHCEQGICVLK
jgi:hypothetical protein